VLESGRFDQGRLEKIEIYVETFDHLPFSADSAVRRWRAFLDLTVGADSRASAIAGRWPPGLAAAFAVRPTRASV